jgi:predicted GIY-YIG superfamily endonuclease
MEDAYENFLKCKKDYYALISERARKKWDRRQKERIDGGA